MTDARLRALDLDQVIDDLRAARLVEHNSWEFARRLVALHPRLATPEGQLAALERLVAPGARVDYFLATTLVDVLGQARHQPAGDLIARLRADKVHIRGLFETLLALDHRPTLEGLDAGLERALARLRRFEIPWDGHHTTESIRDAVVAAFRLAGGGSSERFAAWFSDKSLADDTGAKIAHDILSLGMGIANRHQVQLGTAAGDVLDDDPRWLDLCARLVAHPRLGAIAKAVLKRLPPAERKARIEAKRKRWPARKAKKSAVKKRKPYPVGTVLESVDGEQAVVVSDNGTVACLHFEHLMRDKTGPIRGMLPVED